MDFQFVLIRIIVVSPFVVSSSFDPAAAENGSCRHPVSSNDGRLAGATRNRAMSLSFLPRR